MNSTSEDEKNIIETVKLYFTGTYYGDKNQLQQAFHPDAHITGSINGELCDWTLDDFIARVTSTPTPADKNEKYNKEIIFLDITGNTAMVKAHVVVGAYNFTDYMCLLKIAGQWVIRHKSFTA